jgi:hypothetical protein
MDYYCGITVYCTWLNLGRRPSSGGKHHITVITFCRGPSISGYIEIPCTGIRVKTSTVTEATWDNYITDDGKVRSRSKRLCGASTDRRGSEDGSPSQTLPCAALVTRPGTLQLLYLLQGNAGKKEKYRYQTIFKNIQSTGRENKGIPAELLRTYLKNANLLNPSENIKLPP